jgi:hypothetical protein
MKTFHKLLIIAASMVLLLTLGLLLAAHQVRGAAQAAAALSRTQGLRAEVLLAAAYGADLVSARQRNDALVEQESIRLLNGTLARAGELLDQMQSHDNAGTEAGRDVREVLDLWQLSGDAAEAMVAGRAVTRNLEFLRESSMRLVQRLNALVAAAERQRASGARAALWTLLWLGAGPGGPGRAGAVAAPGRRLRRPGRNAREHAVAGQRHPLPRSDTAGAGPR